MGVVTRIVRAAGSLLRGGAGARLYPSFEAASRDGAYDSELLTRFRVERAKLNVGSISAAHLPPGYALLFAAVHLAPAPVRVTDFGGACGEWGYALGRDARREIDYTVVENPALAAACARDPVFGWARYTASLPDRCDVFLSSGALQYVADPYAILARALAQATTAVVLARNSFSDREIFRVHRSRLGDNGFGERTPPGFDLDAPVRYPHRTLLLDRVLGMAAGWRCLFALESPSGVLPYRGRVFGRDLLFVRR
jgi:hypothetical protein